MMSRREFFKLLGAGGTIMVLGGLGGFRSLLDDKKHLHNLLLLKLRQVDLGLWAKILQFLQSTLTLTPSGRNSLSCRFWLLY